MRVVLAIVFLLIAGIAQGQTRPILPPDAGPFLGGVPSGPATADTLALTIADAINRALEHNLGLLTAEQESGRARGARGVALADLMPNLDGRLAETRQKVNLAAFGFPLPAGTASLVGPFNVFDARIHLSQSIFDLGALNALRAEGHTLAAAEYSVKSARDLVVLVSANAYLQALAAAARAEAARAQTDTAEAIFNQASSMKQSGIVAGIDVLRAEVRLATERQRTTAARNDSEKARLQLARLIGLPIGQPFTLVDDLPNVPMPEIGLKDALERAYRARPDYQAALERVRAAESEKRSVVGEALPSVQVNADYGDIGLTLHDARSTFSVAGAVNVPIFQGGRTHGRLQQADAALRRRRAEADDLKAGIYYDVRGAFLDLQASGEQLQVATRARELSAQQLTQARDRFAAGVASNIEIVQAQEAVAESSEQYISALYSFNVAKALLARGLGVAEEATRQLLGGVR
ncbi:MAG: TolC family protein [Luteitalea sp.]|nr:TolC family protein [Luteitalea sp.]